MQLKIITENIRQYRIEVLNGVEWMSGWIPNCFPFHDYDIEIRLIYTISIFPKKIRKSK